MEKIIITLTPEELERIRAVAVCKFLEEYLAPAHDSAKFSLTPCGTAKYKINCASTASWPELPELFRRNQIKYPMLKEKWWKTVKTVVVARTNFLSVLVAANVVFVPGLFWLLINYA